MNYPHLTRILSSLMFSPESVNKLKSLGFVEEHWQGPSKQLFTLWLYVKEEYSGLKIGDRLDVTRNYVEFFSGTNPLSDPILGYFTSEEEQLDFVSKIISEINDTPDHLKASKLLSLSFVRRQMQLTDEKSIQELRDKNKKLKEEKRKSGPSK